MNTNIAQEAFDLTKVAFEVALEALEMAQESEAEVVALREELESRAVEKKASEELPEQQVKSAAEALCENGLLAESNKEAFVNGIKDGGAPSLLSVLQKVANAKVTVTPNGSFTDASLDTPVDALEDEDELWRSTLQ